MSVIERDVMECDVLIIGGGPAGLSAACRLAQQAQAADQECSIVLLEKGSEIGAHILSGAVLETRALDQLFPDWKSMGAPVNCHVTDDELYFLRSEEKAINVPDFFVPPSLHNDGNYIVSLGQLCRWLAGQAEDLGVEILPGFPAASLLYDDQNQVKGVITGDMGIGSNGEQKDSFEPGMELHARYTLLAEGSRGHLGKEVIKKYELDEEADPQHYALGLKEIWQVDQEQHHEGRVVHTAGWPLSESNSRGGGFLYHAENHQVYVGLITDLNYTNPHVSPFDEFQRLKHHPLIAEVLRGGKRLAYGARAIAKGGFNALPKMAFPGGVLIGCDAGTLDVSKIKGSHTAMLSGMIAAECVFEKLQTNEPRACLNDFDSRFRASWAGQDLQKTRHFAPALHRYGAVVGGAINWFEQRILRGPLPFAFRDKKTDHSVLQTQQRATPINYPKPDNELSFDRLSSVFLSNTFHEEDQPSHLQLINPQFPVEVNLPVYDAPEQRYCPAGVYEIVEDQNTPRLQINAQNCLHCKTCDIKDPRQNIQWVTPEGGGGPNYPNM